MSFVSEIYDDFIHKYLQRKLEEFDKNDASVEEVDEFLAKYGYYRTIDD